MKTVVKKYIKKLSFKALSIIHSLLSRFIFQNSSLVFISYPEASDNPWVLFEEIQRHQLNHALIWLAKDVGAVEDKIKSSNLGYGNVRVIKKYSFLGYLSFLKAKHVFFSHGHYDFVRASGGKKLINLWHGMPIKAIGLLDRDVLPLSQSSDIVIAENDCFIPIMAKAFALTKDNVWPIGQPRCAELFISKDEESCIKKIIGIGENFAVFMPTYRKSIVGDVRNDGAYLDDDEYKREFENVLNKIQSAARKTGFQVLVKIHPMDILNKYSFSNNREILFYSEIDGLKKISIYKILASCETLITDLSSVAIDFMVTGKMMYMAWPSDGHYTRKIVIDKSYFQENNSVAEDYSLIEQHFERVKNIRIEQNDVISARKWKDLTPSKAIMLRLGLLK